MLGAALIVFREVLEAALVIGIACAATRGMAGRNRWIVGGVAAGAAGATLVAAFAGAIASAAEGMGQEIFNAGVLLAAVGMLGWHNVWMARHGRELAQQMSVLGRSVQSGARPLYALGAVIALAVLREGSEIVLFLHGLAAGGSSGASILAGGGVGLAGGGALGVVLYLGLLRVPMKHFFMVTSWMILLLAAGMASQAAGFLIQADYLPALGERLWDSSHFIAADSLAGEVLRTLIGYDAHPAGMQLLFYLSTLTIIGVSMKLFGRPLPVPTAATAAVLAALLAGLLATPRAEAGPADKVYRPVVEYGETEIELRGGYIKDSGPANTTQGYVLDFGHGVTTWWFTEAVIEMEKLPAESFEVEELEWENIFQLSEPGQYFLDYGLFAELKVPLENGHPFALEAGPMFQKEIGQLVNNLNVLVEREFGDNAAHEFEIGYRGQTRYRSGSRIELGAQAFGEEDAHLLGPAVFGGGRMSDHSKYKWDAALLAGLTEDAEDFRLRWEVEFEF
ncbi:MAG TPA: FTR1 family protein [Verrucomicrobiae bacterium]|nr:FTR1 family protein [Verrucomicrobiae bacterium]